MYIIGLVYQFRLGFGPTSRRPARVGLLTLYSPGHDSGFVHFLRGRAKYVLIDIFGTFCSSITLIIGIQYV